MRIRVLFVCLCLCGWAASAQAAFCSFDEGTGVLTVVTEGTTMLLTVSAEGVIEPCAPATTTNTSRIVVIGGNDNNTESITLSGSFAPGRNDVPETDTPEIEIEIIGFNDEFDELDLVGSNQADLWRFTANGINLNDDLDEDIVGPLPPRLLLRGRLGNDTIDASAYTGGSGLNAPNLKGGDGDDVIKGSPLTDVIYGDAGNDVLRGFGGNDHIEDGYGDDLVRGGGGDDYIVQRESDGNGADDIGGGAGADLVSYASRPADLIITLDGIADDGEAGEGDNVRPDVEEIWAGGGDDVLVGSSAANEIWGFGGNDEIHGLGGNDTLRGARIGAESEIGDDILMGGSGNDFLDGMGGNDFLEGGSGADQLLGRTGDDILDGGSGRDFYFGDIGNDTFLNADNFAETIDCGDGIDDPEPDPLDTFIGCENI